MASPKNKYKIRSKVYQYPKMAGWHFIGVPKKQSEEIKKHFGANARGWGSIAVQVTLGKTIWKTSIFPDKMSGSYLLPLKAEVRKKEGIQNDDSITCTLLVE